MWVRKTHNLMAGVVEILIIYLHMVLVAYLGDSLSIIKTDLHICTQDGICYINYRNTFSVINHSKLIMLSKIALLV